MKKNLFIIALLLIIIAGLVIYLIFCDQHNITHPGKGGSNSLITYTVTAGANYSVASYSVANTQIGGYLSNVQQRKPWKSNSFIYNDKSGSLAFLQGYLGGINAEFIHVVISEVSGGGNEMLFLCGVDSIGRHEYIQDASNIYAVATDPNLSFNANVATQLGSYKNATAQLAATVTPGAYTVQATSIQSGTANLLPGDAAQKCISNYAANQTNESAYSFLIPRQTLLDYISSAGTNIAAIQFYLGTTSYDRLILMAVGVDRNGNHVYVNNGTNNCVLEEFMPCPVCVVEDCHGQHPVSNNAPVDVTNPQNTSFLLENPAITHRKK